MTYGRQEEEPPHTPQQRPTATTLLARRPKNTSADGTTTYPQRYPRHTNTTHRHRAYQPHRRRHVPLGARRRRRQRHSHHATLDHTPGQNAGTTTRPATTIDPPPHAARLQGATERPGALAWMGVTSTGRAPTAVDLHQPHRPLTSLCDANTRSRTRRSHIISQRGIHLPFHDDHP